LILLSDTVTSQHDAEERAVMLAKCNKQLEKELHDLDEMALAAQAEYNYSVKENTERAKTFQVRMKFFMVNTVQ
jgi:hypothetical protein